MIKCSHLTPKSIYSYIDDYAIAHCLIYARIGCACLTHISFAILLCEHVAMHIFHLRTSICCFDCLGFSGQVDVQESLSTFSSYLCLLLSNSIHAISQKMNKSFSDPPGEAHSESPI
jgi:hypothetical protein